MTVLLYLAACKSVVMAVAALAAVYLLPSQWVRARRLLALGTVWGLLALPWLPILPGSPVPIPVLPHPPAWGSAWLTLLWGIGSLAMIIRLLAESFRWRQVVRQGTPVVSFVSASGLPVVSSAAVEGPCLVGAFFPTILVPPSALRWPQTHWQAALRHEEQHGRQHDGLHRWIAAAGRALFWWNPLVHILSKRLEIESELACDAAAMANLGPRAYGRLLLSLATDHRSMQTVPAWTARHSLRERIERLVNPPACSRANAVLRGIVAGIMIIDSTLSALVMKNSEAQAEPDETTLRLQAEAFPLH